MADLRKVFTDSGQRSAHETVHYFREAVQADALACLLYDEIIASAFAALMNDKELTLHQALMAGYNEWIK